METKKAGAAARKIVPPYESNPFLVVFKNFINVFKFNKATMIFFISATVIFYTMYFISGFVFGFFDESSTSTSLTKDTATPEYGVIVIIGTFILLLIFWLAYVFVGGMANYAGYMTHLGKKASLKETLNAVLANFGKLFLVSIIWTLIYILWLVALTSTFFAVGELTSYWFSIIPGIFFGTLLLRFLIRYEYVMYPIFSNNTSALGAFKLTKEISKGHLIEILSQYLINNVVSQFTISALVGPIYSSTVSVMYPQMEKAHKAGIKTKTHWANWLVVGLVGFFTLLLIGFAVLIVAVAIEQETKLDNNSANPNNEYQYNYDFDLDSENYKLDSNY